MGRKVVIVDAHEDLLETLADLLGSSGWGPVTTATSASEGFAAIERVRPDVAIVDLSVSGGEGMHLLHRVRGLRASPPVVVLSERSAAEAAVASVRAGARAFVPKTARAKDVIDAAEAVSTGGGWMPKDLLGDVLSRLLEPQAPTEWQVLVSTLTPREREVLDLMIAGYDRPSISHTSGSIPGVRSGSSELRPRGMVRAATASSAASSSPAATTRTGRVAASARILDRSVRRGGPVGGGMVVPRPHP